MPLQPIVDRYALVARHVITIDADGTAWTDAAWWQDLKRHLLYLHDMELVSPVRRVAIVTDPALTEMTTPDGKRLVIRALPLGLDSISGQLRALPRIIPMLWQTAGWAELLQPDNIGWPTGWIGCVLALARGKRLVIMVENAHWRARPGAGIKRRARAFIWENVVRALVKRAAITFYTQPTYRETLPPLSGPGIVTPASWVDDDDLMTLEEAEHAWASKSKRLRLLFAGRLVEDKGIGVLLKAIDNLRNWQCEADIDVIGSGPLRDMCLKATTGLHSVQVKVLDPVSYGPAFFKLVSGYHGIIVPLTSDEQPRIIPDAYGQAVPIIGSNTDGVRPHVKHGENGYLFPVGDAEALAERIAVLAKSPESLASLGLAGLDHVKGMTHLSMHLRRWEQLEKITQDHKGPSVFHPG